MRGPCCPAVSGPADGWVDGWMDGWMDRYIMTQGVDQGNSGTQVMSHDAGYSL